MAILSRKITAFTKKVSDLPDKPGGTVPAADIKAQFDSSPEELRVALNGLIDDLASTATGASGTHNIGSATISGVTGANVYDQLSSLKSQITEAATGAIPDGSLAKAKMDTSVQASLDKADGALLKTGGILTGNPTIKNSAPILTMEETDTSTIMNMVLDGSILQFRFGAAPHPLRIKADKTVEFVDANGQIDTLQNLKSSVDNGKTDIKTAIIGKGGTVAGTSPHSFAELVAGVNSIKLVAKGTGTLSNQTSFTVNGLAFTPTRVIFSTFKPGTTYYTHVFMLIGGAVTDKVRLETIDTSTTDSASATLLGVYPITINGGSFTVTNIDSTHTSYEWAAW